MTARYRVVATTRFGGRRLIYHTGQGRYSWRRGEHGKAWMTAARADGAKKWANRRGARGTKAVAAGKHPFLELADGAAWPTNKRLLRCLNRIGQHLRLNIRIISGLRTPHEAWVLRMKMLNGTGNTAARCCSKYTGVHSWAQCGKDPWSNHADGNAADCGVITRRGRYVSLGLKRKAKRLLYKFGGCLPVQDPYESWHVEMRTG